MRDNSKQLKRRRLIPQITTRRDALVAQMKDVLDGSVTGHREQLIRQGYALLGEARALAGI